MDSGDMGKTAPGATEGVGLGKGKLVFRGDAAALGKHARQKRKESREAIGLGVLLVVFMTSMAAVSLLLGRRDALNWALSTFIVGLSLFLLPIALSTRNSLPTGVFNAYENGFDSPREFTPLERRMVWIRRSRLGLEGRLKDLEAHRAETLRALKASLTEGAVPSQRPAFVSQYPDPPSGARPIEPDSDPYEGGFIPFDRVESVRYEARGHQCRVCLTEGILITLEDGFGFEAYRFVCESLQRRLGTAGPDFEVVRTLLDAEQREPGKEISRAQFASLEAMERKVNGKFR